MGKRVTVSDLILAAVTQPKTSFELSEELKVPHKAVRDRLIGLLAARKVVQVANTYQRTEK
jgi:predicted transcriptional regulator